MTDDIASAVSALFPWVKDGTSIVVLLMLAGRGLKALREGDGIVGLWRSIVYGSANRKGKNGEGTPPGSEVRDA